VKRISQRLSAKAYAASIGVHEYTVQAWCRNSMKPEAERNKALPPVVARKRGRTWEIDVEATERLTSLKCGNPTERELARKAA
jgi:hypothetical protein